MAKTIMSFDIFDIFVSFSGTMPELLIINVKLLVYCIIMLKFPGSKWKIMQPGAGRRKK